jgi:hypothetical protein
MEHRSEIPEDVRNRTAGELMEDVTDSARKALEAGARAAAEMEELQRRTRESLDWRTQIDRHPWALLGGAVAAAILVFAVVRRD